MRMTFWIIMHFKSCRMAANAATSKCPYTLWGSSKTFRRYLEDKSLVPVYKIATAAGMHAPWHVSKVLVKASSCSKMSKLVACAAPA